MAKYEDPNQLDYRNGGDTVDDFAQKYMRTIAYVFKALNDLRTPTGNTAGVEPEPYMWRIADNKLYIRNADNTDYVLLGDISPNFGFRQSVNDQFITTADLEREGTVVVRDANNKVTGDITGSPDKIADKPVDVTPTSTNDILAYDATQQAWVKKTLNDYLKKTDDPDYDDLVAEIVDQVITDITPVIFNYWRPDAGGYLTPLGSNVIAPQYGSTQNSVGAADRPWKEGYFDTLPNWQEYLVESTGYGIVSGCEPTISGLTVTVGAGVVHLAGGTRKEIPATNITLDAADSTNPRIDLVYIDSTGTVAKVTGTASASPSVPTLPSDGISVCNVTIAAGASTGTVNRVQTIAPNLANYGVVNVKDYGAKGDGVTDDTEAILAAIKNLRQYDGRLFFPPGVYITTKSLVLEYFNCLLIDARAADIEYRGSGYAIEIRGLRNCLLHFGNIVARNGSCIYLNGTDKEYYTQYIDFYFTYLIAKNDNDCVYCEINKECWVNEIRWHNGMFAKGKNGVKVINNNVDNGYTCGQWIFITTVFEGVNNAIFLDASNEAKNTNGCIPFSCWYFQQCRLEELPHIATINCAAQGFLLVGAYTKDAFIYLQRMTLNSKVDFRALTGEGIYDVTFGTKLGYVLRRCVPLMLNEGAALTQNVDLNNINEVGVYFSDSWEITDTLQNKPAGLGVAFRLEVFSLTSSSDTDLDMYPMLCQKITSTSLDVYLRRLSFDFDSQTWAYSAWKQVSFAS